MKTTGWINVTGTYPSIEAKNSTTPTSKDGTPINKDLIDEIFGSFQAVISQGNVTPNDSTEVYDDSDIVRGIMNIAGSPGELVFRVNYFSSQATAQGERLLYLNGSTVLVSNYPELTLRSYCGDAANPFANGFYRCDNSDGSGRNTSGAYLYLPDYRGYFVRCQDGTTTVDPDSRLPHSVQDDAVKDHLHYLTNASGEYMISDIVNHVTGSDDAVTFTASAYPGNAILADDSLTLNADETRPINRNVHCFVRY